MTPRGRFAPSPTGAMHLGNARTALLAWLDARSRGGAFVLRIEDLDPARVRPGAEALLLEDLTWLGLDWDEGPDRGGPVGPYRQSERTAHYDAAIERLLATGRAFFCACSRADVERAISAPHDDGPDEEAGPSCHRYPGTCRGRTPGEVAAVARAAGRAPAVRFDGRGERIAFIDELAGPVAVAPGGVDDFVLRNALGSAAYHLAVVVDDAAMGVTRIVRGADLLGSTAGQIALGRALGLPVPAYAHVPLVLRAGGERLAKRTRPLSIEALRQAGVPASVVLSQLASSLGDRPPRPIVHPTNLLPGFSLDLIARAPAVLDLISRER